MYESLLRAFRALAPISDTDWEMIRPQLTTKQYKRGEYHLQEGAVENQIGFILTGSFRWFYLNGKGDEVNYNFFFEQMFVVGYDSYVSQTPSRMSIQALEDSEVVMLPLRPQVEALYDQSHNWERFGRLICEQVYAYSSRRAQDFLFHSAEERYLNLLQTYPDIFQRLSLAQIASYLGVQPPSLSRIRKRLAKGDSH
jgi:CRP-like cAMP-binding protein